MIDNFFLFSDLNRDSQKWTIDQAFETKGAWIISMTEDEDSYLFSMQFMLGEVNVIPFQKFHDDLWDLNRNKPHISQYMQGVVFCTDQRLQDFMMSYRGDLDKDKIYKEKIHWSQSHHQITLNGVF